MCIPGMISMWGGAVDNIPAGWLLCNGAVINQIDYPDLYKAIGLSFGQQPPENDTFYLPDLRGRFIRGVDDSAGRDPDVSSRTDMQNDNIPSETVGSIQSHALQQHFHWSVGVGADPNNQLTYGPDTPAWTSGEVLGGLPPFGCNLSHETRPVNAYLHFIVKY
jgi:microcystin-dependent protein